MDILIISHFGDTYSCNDNDRFLYIANYLQKFHTVEIVTSNFIHTKKAHRGKPEKEWPFKITFLREPGYSKNVCLTRFYSHFIWGLNLLNYLKKRKKPDVVFCAIPSLTGPYLIAKYCKNNNIKFVIDIQDLWPEAYKMVFNIPVLSDVIFAPFTFLANYIYKRADEIVAVSQTYVDRALKVNRKTKIGHSVFLGTNLSDFDNNVNNNPIDEKFPINIPHKKKDELWLAYCGTLGASYDLTCVFKALEIIKNKGINSPKFIIMGDGPRKQEFENYANLKNLDVFFTGRLSYPQMCSLLYYCDITVNPITKGAAQSIINKHADYAASGLPVINTQECNEYRDLIETYKMGFNCINGNAQDLARNLTVLIQNKDLRLKMGMASRKCAEEKFDRKYSYQEIYSLISGDLR